MFEERSLFADENKEIIKKHFNCVIADQPSSAVKGEPRNPDARAMVQEWNRGIILWLVSPDKEKKIDIPYMKYKEPADLRKFLNEKIAEEKMPAKS